MRSQSGKFDGKLMSHRWCALCCAAMVLAEVDPDEFGDGADEEPWAAYEARSGLADKQKGGEPA